MTKKANKIAFGGMLLALLIVLMYIEAVFPLMDRSFLLLSGVFVMTAIIEYSIRYGFSFYLSAVVLGLIVTPEKSGVIMFAGFFGLYPMVKFFIDKLESRVLRIILKLAVGNILLAIGYTVLKLLGFMEALIPKIVGMETTTLQVIVGILVIYQIAVIVYDYFLSLYEKFYNNRIRRHIKGLVNRDKQ